MDWLNVLKQFAPWIATAIGGPLGGAAVSAAASALGLSDKTEAALKNAIAGITPEQVANMKKADQDFELHMKEIGFQSVKDLEEIAAADRASARDMQKSTQSWVPPVLTFFVVSAFSTLLLLLLKIEIPGSNRDIVNIMIGQLSGGFASSLAFWLGTTREGSRKTELLAQAAPVRPDR